jgi:EAL domain-containing protein (putative c-di-GMP-specific phosphodiesterase class I)
LMQTITSTGIDPQRLAIELESSSEEADYERLKHFVGLLNGTGALVGIDDFAGTPIDLIPVCELGIGFVKLSRSLLPSSGMSGRGAQAIVALANALEWEVIATRVASSDDRRLIRSAGVHYMQGFECAQPMTAVDFQSWVESTAVDVGVLHGT